jgi:hypothetical protein
MKVRIGWFMLLLISACIITGCSAKSRYEHRLKHELARGVRCDSLFMGLYLGMPQKDFYSQCWKLNRQGLIRQGSNNTTVEYILKGELTHPGTMNFYPKFIEGKISEMPVKYSYSGWAPWNRVLTADNLEADLLRYYKKTYGAGFIPVKHRQHGIAYIKIDGNRRISIFKENDLNVWAVFTDMLAKKDSTGPVPGSVNDQNNLNKDSLKK